MEGEVCSQYPRGMQWRERYATSTLQVCGQYPRGVQWRERYATSTLEVCNGGRGMQPVPYRYAMEQE